MQQMLSTCGGLSPVWGTGDHQTHFPALMGHAVPCIQGCGCNGVRDAGRVMQGPWRGQPKLCWNGGHQN